MRETVGWVEAVHDGFYELVERLLRVGWIALAPLGQWSILMGWPCQCKPAEPTP